MFKFYISFYFLISILISTTVLTSDFSERKNFNNILKGFYKNKVFECNYINKSWSTGYEEQPYGMVNNNGAFTSITVFNHQNYIGTLWPKIGEISTERGVRKYQIWKKNKNEEYVLVPTDYLEDKNSSDINIKELDILENYKTYFDKESLKIASKSWITDFYKCEEIEQTSFARKKLIDIFVNQNMYVKKDFKYRERNPTAFSNKIDLIKD